MVNLRCGGTISALVLLAVGVSALASTQTTILPASLSTLSLTDALSLP